MASSRRHNELLAEVKSKFGGVIGKGEGKVPVHQAARTLNVSRQTVHRYINGEVVPRGDVLMAAFRAWGLVLHYRGINVTVATPVSTEAHDARAVPVQMQLFELVDELRDRDVEVRIGKMSAAGLELNVKLKFSA